ncbi:tumor necrosis factor a (TNF superfamily, member 2) [Salmo salar]|uniref:Tumor necrosis factor n=1 Tax=Salmo salar TaxID=8030 RepID=A0A0U4XLS0_SALSA|nr:tumor necrosis factor a (TNF superfamily, member 2) [Salmo salar]CDM74098.1 TNF-alpha-4 isoform [Salmo salar]|eukprot:XP_014034205.1 PREDICTED: tumor necrosis factor-like [Salmo salar]
MEGDCSRVMVDMESGPVYPATTVTLVREKSSHQWRLCGALLAIALFVSAALFITWHAKKQDQVEEVDELQHTLRQLSGNIKAAIHLEGEYNSSGKYKTTVEWTDSVGQVFSQGGLKLNNNEIVIPQTGLYFVYSQVSFHVSCKANPKHPNNQEMVHLSNTVKRWSPSYGSADSKEYLPLLNSVRTVCKKSSNSEASEGKWYNAVYMGAVFNLEKGDLLRTVTENRLLPHLESGAGKNFFGVFAL